MCAVLTAITPVTCISELAMDYFILSKYYLDSLLFQMRICVTAFEQLQIS